MPDPTGWMPGVEHIPAREWGYADIREDDMWPKAVMHHVMQGYRSTMDAWARSEQAEGVSVQFGINRAGEIAQYVSIWNPAYHAGDVNRPDDWGAVMLGRYGWNPNKWAIGVEWEGFSKDPIAYDYDYLYGEGTDPKGRERQPWPEAMVEAAIRIQNFVFRSTQELVDAPDRAERVLSHSQTNQATRGQDPGTFWIATVKPRLVAAARNLAVPLPEPASPPEPAPAQQAVPVIAIRGHAQEILRLTEIK